MQGSLNELKLVIPHIDKYQIPSNYIELVFKMFKSQNEENTL